MYLHVQRLEVSGDGWLQLEAGRYKQSLTLFSHSIPNQVRLHRDHRHRQRRTSLASALPLAVAPRTVQKLD